jgi:uncharacterized integral membrane protein
LSLIPWLWIPRLPLRGIPVMTEACPMIRKIAAIVILVPLVLLIMTFAVANRAPVTVSLDPFGALPPMFSATSPLFVILLIVLTAGVIIGGVAAWARQSKWRRRARRLAADLKAAHAETEALRQQLAASAAAQAQAQTSIAAIAYRHPSAA